MKDEADYFFQVDGVARRLMSNNNPEPTILYAARKPEDATRFFADVRKRMAELEPERCATCRKIRPWCEC